MERDDLASLAGVFFDAEPLATGTVVRLGDDAAHHVRVRRLELGDRIYLADGAGTQAVGAISRLTKKDVEVAVVAIVRFDRPAAIHALIPIADRERMLWCAEKCTELGAASWRPVMWNRSRSVSPRGEGAAFSARVRARMASAVVQSHAPWLPDVCADASLTEAVSLLPEGGTRLALDASGDPIAAERIVTPVTIAVGPEGGMEPGELETLRDSGFRTVSLGANVLRFETAAVAALAIVRSALAHSPETTHG